MVSFIALTRLQHFYFWLPYDVVFSSFSSTVPTTEPVESKTLLIRRMAERCVAGEFGGSAWRAAAMPECIALRITHQSIEYHMGKINTADSASRVADRARVEAETAQAKAEMKPVAYIFVERNGSAPAAAAQRNHP
jgi:hypothetical protein